MTALSGEAENPRPEATLIRLARQARGLSPEAAAELTPIRLGGSRWREIEKGYKGKSARQDVRAPGLTLAHMAHAVGLSPERLDEAGRGDAAEILREILRQEEEVEVEPAPYADLADPLERAAWEADLPLNDRKKMIDLLRGGRARERQPQPPASERQPVRTDLSDVLRARRLELGLSLEEVAARAVGSGGERLVEADWLGRLESASLAEGEHPEYPQLDALAEALSLHPAQLQELAGIQFMDVHTIWSDDGQTSALVIGDLDEEGLRKVHRLMHLYGKSPSRDGRN
ncbi:helix-turn-helix domain-containing protein [Streptomyces liliifuscus]|uniref:Helix-turn-helix domain-containing protein n=1 Tax=Streptomyces liliifuscus TaxID=2797636 RepID=A0A7T7RFR2_9ACTN|nr:helix-turn-helix domain-containing protein [Streptomyces liliifuscus]QQM44970.1 helix-turn-helix domain-containing protein [Streptomyces liliifuscus]